MIALRLLLTTLFAIAAVSAGIYLWDETFNAPWTRDAHVRATIVEVAPRISGDVVTVAVRNNQRVASGDLLFEIDDRDYVLALESAAAARDQADAQYQLQRQQSDRYDALKARGSQAVPDVEIEAADLRTQSARAALQAAEAAVKTAELNLERTSVRAPVAGWIANLSVDVGDIAAANEANLAIVDETSFRIDAFFLETALPRIAIGAPARIKLMAGPDTLAGRVVGISAGIAFGEDFSPTLLQAPEPSFRWVRLAQRVPIEIAFDSRSQTVPLVNGLTATVIVETAAPTLWQKTSAAIGRWWERTL